MAHLDIAVLALNGLLLVARVRVDRLSMTINVGRVSIAINANPAKRKKGRKT